MDLADSLHSPHAIHHGKMIWMMWITISTLMMLILQSLNLGESMGRKQVIRLVHHPINLKTHK